MLNLLHHSRKVNIASNFNSRGQIKQPIAYKQKIAILLMNLQSKWYVSSLEASWKILEFPIIEAFPALVRLPVHQEDQQLIFFNPRSTQKVEDSLIHNQNTMLTAYFQANIYYEEARNYFYRQFPEHFVYKCNEKWWQPCARPSSTPQSSWTS